jgi:hypothetical protein
MKLLQPPYRVDTMGACFYRISNSDRTGSSIVLGPVAWARCGGPKIHG